MPHIDPDICRLPSNLDVVTLGSIRDLLIETAESNMSDATILHGQFYIQGRRGFFNTALSIPTYLDIVTHDTAKAKATVADVQRVSNRKTDSPHLAKTIRYLEQTAKEGEPFILPSFTLNYGTHSEVAERSKKEIEDGVEPTPVGRARLYVVWRDGEQSMVAAMAIPPHLRMPVTDGAHRTKALQTLHRKLKDSPEGRTLRANALPVVVGFDDNLRQVHQDFADCASTKPMAASVRSVYDSRDNAAAIAVELIKSIPLLNDHVDGTAQSYNVSNASPHIYTMAAMRAHVERILELDLEHGTSFLQRPTASIVEGRAGVGNPMLTEFWTAITTHLVAFQRVAKDPAAAPSVRAGYGGSIWFKPAGLSLLARVYWTWRRRQIPLATVIQWLVETDDSLLIHETYEPWTTAASAIDANGGRTGYAETAEGFINSNWTEFWKLSRDRNSLASNKETVGLVWDRLFDRSFMRMTPMKTAISA